MPETAKSELSELLLTAIDGANTNTLLRTAGTTEVMEQIFYKR
ncbi:hypothetical protein QA584_08450 [Anaerocolumna sp. AGMB13025]|nr:hypothetical protein [Anaerocolumna sp. AGMB13025]WFR59102.1 hypothetical protein QA584_08450 [Anaerocolumna sp. AGMB13025]